MIRLGTFSRDVLVLMSGTVAAQAISVLISPLLTRLYTPADFGVYSLFVSMTTLLGAVVCGRYELSITLPAETRDALALLGLCTVVAFGLGLLLVPVVFFGKDLAVDILNEPRLGGWLWLLPAAMALMGLASGARYWLIRIKAFRTVSTNGVLRSGLTALCNVTFGVLGWLQFGLIGGFLIGLFVSVAFLTLRIWRESGAEIRKLHWSDLRAQAYAQRRFPQYSLGSAVVESGAAQVPVFVFSSLFGASTLGLFSLAQRIANLPLSLVASSVGDVFRQQASEVYAREGNCRALFDRTFHKLLWASLPGFALAAWLSPWLFSIVFGPDWRESGEFVRILIPALALRFVSSPLSSMFYIAQRQVADLSIQVGLVVAMVGVFLCARHEGWTARQVVIGYSVIYGVKYILEFCLSRRFARGATVTP